MTELDQLAATFEGQRPYLHAIAARMLGSDADADDAVQEAWLRLARTGADDIDELRAWLTTVTGRICLDILRRRRTRGEQPLAEVDDTPADHDPEADALLADSLGLALYVVMDALTPAERVSFVLHDVFEMPFDTIAAVLGRSTAATKMLASRARGRIRSGEAAEQAHSVARSVVDAFLAAGGRGDVAGLLAVLAPDVELHTGEFVVRGAETVATNARFGARQAASVLPVQVDGLPGALVSAEGRPMVLLTFLVEEERISRIWATSDPDRLTRAVLSWIV